MYLIRIYYKIKIKYEPNFISKTINVFGFKTTIQVFGISFKQFWELIII